jgi:histidyl-tRNA synthetase
VDVYVLIEAETQRLKALEHVQQLRTAGLVVEYSLVAAKPEKQFKRAQELNARFTLKLDGESGLHLRDLKSRADQPVTNAAAAIEAMKASVSPP